MNENNITEHIASELYNDYYSSDTDWDAYYEHLAEKSDRKWEDL